MQSNFVSIDRDTPYLLPPSLQDWLPKEHLARFVVDIAEQLDLRPIKNSYAGKGSKPYHPAMMVALLFYGYATGVFSSRKLERSTYDSVAFRYITANTHPDHDTIATFRKRFLPELSKLFVQILMIAKQMELLKLGNVSLDGTKIKANASKHRALSYGHACKIEAQLKAEVSELLKKAETADHADQVDGMSIPEELNRREKRLDAILNAKAQIEQRALNRYNKEQTEYNKKIAARAKKESESGKKAPGKPPKPPTASPAAKDQINLTDKQSRIMPISGGGFEQSYNAQAAVDTLSKLIVTAHITQKPNDKQELLPTLYNLCSLPKSLGTPTAILADSGYYSEHNIKACEDKSITPFIAFNRQCHHQPVWERFKQPPPICADADLITKMKHRLKTAVGKAIYALRKTTSEPVFGIIKAVMGFKGFLLRGKEAVSGEWTLACMAYNIKKMHSLLQQTKLN